MTFFWYGRDTREMSREDLIEALEKMTKRFHDLLIRGKYGKARYQVIGPMWEERDAD